MTMYMRILTSVKSNVSSEGGMSNIILSGSGLQSICICTKCVLA